MHNLEKEMGDTVRAVEIRRKYVSQAVSIEGRRMAGAPILEKLPYTDFDAGKFYDSVDGANCESVIG